MTDETHDPYEDTIEDPGCRRMRAASGRVNDDRPLVIFLYLLARDHLAVGVVEDILMKSTEIPESRDTTYFTNGWLASWAQDAAKRMHADD